MKEDSSGGIKERRIELEMRFWKGEWITKNTMNTVVKLTKENVSFISKNICLFLTIVPLLKVKKIERFRMKRCLEEGEAVMAVITSLCECFLFLRSSMTAGREDVQ